MNEVLIEAKVRPNDIKTLKILGIVYLIIVPFFILGIVFLIAASGLKNQSLIVTKHNIRGSYGKFSKRQYDLPIDSITGVSSLPNGLIISTPSERITYTAIINYQEVVSVINEQLRDRQTAKSVTITEAKSEAEELKKFKDLLDAGIISQEEFDAKKKQLLGL